MASDNHSTYTADLEAEYKRDVKPNYRERQASLRVWDSGLITITSAVADGDVINLGKIGVGGTILPELCRICGESGSIVADFIIEKVNEAGTAAALTGVAQPATDGTAVAFARHADGLKTFDASDYLRLDITESTTTDLAANDTLTVQIVYFTEEAI